MRRARLGPPRWRRRTPLGLRFAATRRVRSWVSLLPAAPPRPAATERRWAKASRHKQCQNGSLPSAPVEVAPIHQRAPKTALATAPFLFLPGCSMHQGSSEWTNRNNCTLCNLASGAGRFRLCWVIDYGSQGSRERLAQRMREQDQMFCPRCAAPLLSVLDILDTVHDKTVRLLRFQCGEIIWSD